MAMAHPYTFGNLLRRSRLAAGLTMEELASRAGVSAKGIGALERGERRAPRKETIVLLADALRLDGMERTRFVAAARWTEPAITPAPLPEAPAGVPPIVGRAAELVRLEHHLAGNGPPLLLLVGDPGIGKTRLLREAARMGRGNGWGVLESGCHRSGGQEPYAPVLGALEQHVRAQSPARLRAALEGCAWLVRLLPELAESSLVASPQEKLSPMQERRLMFAAVGRFLRNIATPVGTLLVLDDLQWADADALDLLATLIRSATDPPLRIAGAYRSTEITPRHPLGVLQHDLMREDRAAIHSLEPLRTDEAHALLDVLLDGQEKQLSGEMEEDATGLREQVIERAGGLPLFLVSYALRLRARERGDKSATDVTDVTDIPADIADSIRQRVAVLPAGARELLSVASVVGRNVSGDLLTTLTTQTESETLDAIEAICYQRLLVESADGSYQFSHDVIREVVEADLSAIRRKRLHRQVAEALERGGTGNVPVEQIADHYLKSDQKARALDYLILAAEQAMRRYEHARAETYYRAILELARMVGAQAREAEALMKLGEILSLVARILEAAEMFRQAAAIYRQIGDLDSLAQATSRLANMLDKSGHSAEALAALAELLDVIAASEEPVAMALPIPQPWISFGAPGTIILPGVNGDGSDTGRRIAQVMSRISADGATQFACSLASIFISTNRTTESLAVVEYAMPYAQQAHAEHARMEILNLRALAISLSLRGQLSESIAVFEEAARLAERSGDMSHLVSILTNLGAAYEEAGNLPQAFKTQMRAMQVASQYGLLDIQEVVLCNLAEVSFFTGQWQQARMYADQAYILGVTTDPPIDTMALVMLSLLAISESAAGGPPQMSEVTFDELLHHRDAQARAYISGALAERELMRDRPGCAREILNQFYARTSMNVHFQTWHRPLLIWALLDLGEQEQAEEMLYDLLAQPALQEHRLFYLVDALRIQGLLTLRAHRWHEGTAALDESLRLSREMGYPYAEAKALYVYGQLHLARHEPELARDHLTESLAMLNWLGERLYAERVEQALAAIEQD